MAQPAETGVRAVWNTVDATGVVGRATGVRKQRSRGGGKKKKGEKGGGGGDRRAEPKLIAGDPGMFEARLRDKRFRLSPRSFFQTNDSAAERLLEEVERACGVGNFGGERKRGGVLLDAFCGVGTFAIALAAHFDKVVGVDVVEASIADARANAEANGLSRDAAEFAVANLIEAGAVQRLPPAVAAADVVLVDPARAGLDKTFVRFLRAHERCQTVCYVSCNPSTAARDCAALSAPAQGQDTAYRIASVAAVDMFPHSGHLEAVVTLKRVEDGQ